MSQTTNKVATLSDDKATQDKQNKKLSAAIGVAVEMESSFKLFSYRIIDQDTYISKIEELVNFYKNQSK